MTREKETRIVEVVDAEPVSAKFDIIKKKKGYEQSKVMDIINLDWQKIIVFFFAAFCIIWFIIITILEFT